MLDELSQKQIEQDVIDASIKTPDCWVDITYNKGYKDAYEACAEKYTPKWQQAEQMKDRYEKALRAILDTNHDNHERVIMKVKQIATEALTPKTSSDDTANG